MSNPQNLNCDVKDNTTIFLSWGRPVKYADIDDYTVHIIHGGKTIEKLKIPHTKELKYLIKNLSRGMWYYAKVKANPRRSRVEEIRRQSKKQIAVPDYYSKVVACQTVDDSEYLSFLKSCSHSLYFLFRILISIKVTPHINPFFGKL